MVEACPPSLPPTQFEAFPTRGRFERPPPPVFGLSFFLDLFSKRVRHKSWNTHLRHDSSVESVEVLTKRLGGMGGYSGGLRMKGGGSWVRGWKTTSVCSRLRDHWAPWTVSITARTAPTDALFGVCVCGANPLEKWRSFEHRTSFQEQRHGV